MISATAAPGSHSQGLAQLVEIVCTTGRSLADFPVGNSFADAYVHGAIQTQMRMIVN